MKCVSITNQFTSVKSSVADLIVDSNVDSHLNLETEKQDKGPRYGGSAMFDQFSTALGTLERTVDVRGTRASTLKFNKTSKFALSTRLKHGLRATPRCHEKHDDNAQVYSLHMNTKMVRFFKFSNLI